MSLLHQEGDAAVPDSVLKAALLRRAVEDIQRLIQIKTAKQACSSLLQRGSVGDDLWQRFQRAEREMEEELRDVVTEVRSPPPFFFWPRFARNWAAGSVFAIARHTVLDFPY